MMMVSIYTINCSRCPLFVLFRFGSLSVYEREEEKGEEKDTEWNPHPIPPPHTQHTTHTPHTPPRRKSNRNPETSIPLIWIVVLAAPHTN